MAPQCATPLDGLQRLTGAAEAPGATYGYTYDLAGNRTDVSVNGATTATYAYDALGELTGTSAISATRAYSYNGDGTLVAQVAGGATTRYAQDFAAGQAQVLAAISGSATTDFLYGDGPERLAATGAGLRTWYGTDVQGSVRQTLDDSANVLATQSYDPYGQPETAAHPSQYFGYTGELQDGSSGTACSRSPRPASATLFTCPATLRCSAPMCGLEPAPCSP